MDFVDYIFIKMSDILTSYSSCVFDDQIDSDNLVEFLTKLARFGIDQCLHFAHLIVNKQRFIENLSTCNDKYQIYQDKRVNKFLIFSFHLKTITYIEYIRVN
jgi:hypothetical protein